MGMCQFKKSFNNLKSNMVTPGPNTVTPEASGHTTGRLDHPNPEEVKENDFKCNFMRMMETFNKKMKNSLKEMEEKTKKWKKSINLSKKTMKTKKKNQMGEAKSTNSSRLED